MDSLDGLIDIDRIEPQSREDYDDQCREWESLPHGDESWSYIHMDDLVEYVEHIWELGYFHFMQSRGESNTIYMTIPIWQVYSLLYECWFYGIQCNSRDRVLRWSIDEAIWVDEIDEAIGWFVIEPDDTDFFEKETRTLVPDLFACSNWLYECDLPSLSTRDRCITRILGESYRSTDPTSSRSTVETSHSRYLRIWDASYLYLVIWSEQLECSIHSPDSIWILLLECRRSSVHCERLSIWDLSVIWATWDDERRKDE